MKKSRRPAKRSPCPRKRFGHVYETLEGRALLAADAAPWHNINVPEDVNGDFMVTPVDALRLIDALNRRGIGLLDPLAIPASIRGLSSAALASSSAQYLDVTGDGLLAPNDLLHVIDRLNQLDPDLEEIRLRPAVFDLGGNEITEIVVGTDFLIGLVVEDISTIPVGVLSAYADVKLDNAALASFNSGPLSATPVLQYHPHYSNAQTGNLVLATREINDAGAFGDPSGPPNNLPDPVTLFTTTMTADAAGVLTFTTDATENAQFADLLLYGSEDELAIPTYGPPAVLTAVGEVAPTVSVLSDIVVPEGNASGTFTVTLSLASARDVYVIYSTTDGTASAGSDYDAQISQTLTFLSGGPLTAVVNVPVQDDSAFEGDETFNLNLLFASNALIGDGLGEATIVEDDIAPLLTISDETVVEGDIGDITNMVFKVTLSPAAAVEVTVGFSTQSNTATEGLDFTAQSGQLTFAPGDTEKQIVVPIIGDLLSEGFETFFVNLSSAVGALIADDRGIGNIIDNDAQGFSVTDASVLEGDTGDTPAATFTVTLSSPQPIVTTVVYTTDIAGGTATSGVDFQPTVGTLTFAPDQTSQTFTVLINGDDAIEPNETFGVTLSNPTGTVLLDPTGTGTIFDDDDPGLPDLMRFTFRAFDSSNVEILSGGSIGVGENFRFEVYVDDLRPGIEDIGVLSAYEDILYTASLINAVGPLTFNPVYNNARTGNFATDGLINEVGAFDGPTPLGPAEQFLFSIPMVTQSSGVATFAGESADNPTSEVILYNAFLVPLNQIDFGSFTLNIGANSFQVSDVTELEGDLGTTAFNFTVTRFNPDGTDASVVFTAGGQPGDTATLADNDYQALTQTLNFLGGGSATQTVTVLVNGDTKNELDETFTVTLTNPTNATIGDAIGIGTITNDDAAPTISIGPPDPTGPEGTNLLFPVTLSAVSGLEVTVAFTTAVDVGPNPATPGTDFTTTSGVLTFAPNSSGTQFISVAALTDFVDPEPSETFRVVLSAPVNAGISDGTAIGTIVNAPPAGISGFVYIDADDDGRRDPNEVPNGLAGVIVTVVRDDGTLTRSTITDANGFYSFVNLPPDTYFVTQTQPGFYRDGRENRPPLATGVTIVANDQYQVDLLANPTVTNLNFGELGVRPEFIAEAMGRRIHVSTTLDNPPNGLGSPIVNADLTKGDIWVSFDAGWDGLRKIQAFFTQGNVTFELYAFDFRGDLRRIDSSQIVNGRPEIAWVDALEKPATPLFLKISGTSRDASIKIIDTLRVEAQTVLEGNTGTTNTQISVKLSAPQTGPVVVQYATANNTATASTLTTTGDYTATSGLLTFAAGETEKLITVPIVGDLLDEDNETFFVNLTNASMFVEVAPGPFAITITDEDQSPKVNISDATIAEGNGSVTNAIFNVILTAPSGRVVTVAYTTTTSGGNATAGSDYTSVSGILTFTPGTPSAIAQVIAVPILGDTFVEGNETFNVALSLAVNVNILDGVALGTITNDDFGPAFTALSAQTDESGSGILSYNESSEDAPTTESSSNPPAAATTSGRGGYSSRVSSRGRSSTSAVDAAMADEDDWALVA